jgi:hypothetical protein
MPHRNRWLLPDLPAKSRDVQIGSAARTPDLRFAGVIPLPATHTLPAARAVCETAHTAARIRD